ncbi:MAG: Carbohydrate phosphorylase [Methanosaeta sp. PtaB.Bin039]|nr:MAG: Carbohydrate phosphorylase [Methanosaeta sp. PtaB.Bin039]
MSIADLDRQLPEGLEGLADLASDLRWNSMALGERIWQRLDPDAWSRSSNPYLMLQNVSGSVLEAAASDQSLKRELQEWQDRRRGHLDSVSWFSSRYRGLSLVAYFSMEFGLGESLPVYSGGLGILAGDFLKTASDLGVPVVGMGLLYQQGYFRQVIAKDGSQVEAFPYNDPTILPVVPVQDRTGGRLRVKIALPGRELSLRVWLARVGRVGLYLLDSNDPLNSPWDRGVTANLYAPGNEKRLIQEIALGSGGWLALEALGLSPDVCHINEGHAAFVILARAYSFMRQTGLSFQAALWATRGGNVFTAHTPVAAGFDRLDPALVRQYGQAYADLVGIDMEDLLSLGRQPAGGDGGSVTGLALRGSLFANGVSRLHGQVCRRLFSPLYPRWPWPQVPVIHITNGVHVPTWESPQASLLWACTCGESYWASSQEAFSGISEAEDRTIWTLRSLCRQGLVDYVRSRLVRQMVEHCAPPEEIRMAKSVLDPAALTLGFARRFAEYKRPNLLLHDRNRLIRLLSDQSRPVQLVLAGKAHPNDEEGKSMIRELASFASRQDLAGRVVFLEDYDMVLAQRLVAGIDVWINLPRRPMEACGTSGMKVLVNGGLNLSTLDGWWDEAYKPGLGWAVGGDREVGKAGDARDGFALYRLLEEEVIPEFYQRDEDGLPRSWIARIRRSMTTLTPQFSSNRMMQEYLEKLYLPAASAYRRRSADGGRLARELEAWQSRIEAGWSQVRFVHMQVDREGDDWQITALVHLGSLQPEDVKAEVYADPLKEEQPFVKEMDILKSAPREEVSWMYQASVPASRPSHHYTPRLVPYHKEALVPKEEGHILWQR